MKTAKKKCHDQEVCLLKRHLEIKCKLFQKQNRGPQIGRSFFKSLKQYRKATKSKARQYKKDLKCRFKKNIGILKNF